MHKRPSLRNASLSHLWERVPEGRERERGLTMLEMIVVLLIASLAITLAFQSLGQWQRARAAVANISGAIQEDFLTERWLESSLRSLIALDGRPFAGSATELKGVAIQPVLSHQGGDAPVEWSLLEDGEQVYLHLNENGQSLSLSLPDVVAARFRYQDKDGTFHAQWPPALGLHDQLPALIALEQELGNGRQRVWASSISGARNPYYNPFELEDD